MRTAKGLGCLLLMSLGPGSLVPASAGETVTYRGVGTFVANRSTLPLANGGAAFQLANEIVATIEPSDSGVLYGDCAGLGYADGAGEYSMRAFCTFAENDTDGFAIDGSVEPAAGGTVKIIGAAASGPAHQATERSRRSRPRAMPAAIATSFGSRLLDRVTVPQAGFGVRIRYIVA